MNLTDLGEVKGVLRIDPDNTLDDKRLTYFIRMASAMIETFLNTPGLFYMSRTQYYNGSGTQKLLLRCRPAYTTPTPRVWIDEKGLFGSSSGSFLDSTELTYGTDFSLWTNNDASVCTNGILIRRNDVWPRPVIRQRGLLSPYIGEGFGTVKITYTAGYDPNTLPDDLALAVIEVVGRMRGYFPNALEINSESYEDRSVSFGRKERDYLLGDTKRRIGVYRNWRF